MSDNFTEVPYKTSNLDRYYIRNSILKSLNEFVPSFKGELLDLGCGQMPYREFINNKSRISEYIGVDLENGFQYHKTRQPDLTWDGICLPFPNNKFGTVILTEVLEHVPNPNVTLQETHRVLQKGGLLFFTVPFLWPLHDVPNDEFRYTPFALKRLLQDAGYDDIVIKPTGGWHASMAQMLGLWVRRSHLSKRIRIAFSYILKPIIKILIAKDKIPLDFSEGQMITGLYGVAYKH